MVSLFVLDKLRILKVYLLAKQVYLCIAILIDIPDESTLHLLHLHVSCFSSQQRCCIGRNIQLPQSHESDQVVVKSLDISFH